MKWPFSNLVFLATVFFVAAGCVCLNSACFQLWTTSQTTVLASIAGLFALICCLEVDSSYRAADNALVRQRCPVIGHVSLTKLEEIQSMCKKRQGTPLLDSAAGDKLRALLKLRGERITWRGDIALACIAALTAGLAFPLGSCAQILLVFFVVAVIASRRHGWDYAHGGLQHLDNDISVALALLEGREAVDAKSAMPGTHCLDKRADPWNFDAFF